MQKQKVEVFMEQSKPQEHDVVSVADIVLSGSTASLGEEIDLLKKEIDELKKLVISHENELKQRKQITNTYVDAVLNKMEILKNIIKKNIGDDDTLFSQHLLIVESIEGQIKSTGKISDSQFKTLNDIYKKQKRV